MIPGKQLKKGKDYIGKTKRPNVADRMKNADHRTKTLSGKAPKAKTLATDLSAAEGAGVEAVLIQGRGLDNLSNTIPGLNFEKAKNQSRILAGLEVLGLE